MTFHPETARALLLRGRRAFRAQSYRGVKQQPIGSSWDVFGLAGAAYDAPTITGRLFSKCRVKVMLLRQMTAQILSVQKSLQDAETGVIFYTKTARACFYAAGVAFRAQSHSGVKQQLIGSSRNAFGLAGMARFGGVWRSCYNRETFFKMQGESSASCANRRASQPPVPLRAQRA